MLCLLSNEGVKMPFSTWSDLLAKMRNDLATGNWRKKSYDIDGMKTEFFSPEEFLKMYAFVEKRAVEESSDYCASVSMRSRSR